MCMNVKTACGYVNSTPVNVVTDIVHNEVMTWKCFPYYCSFVDMDSRHKGLVMQSFVAFIVSPIKQKVELPMWRHFIA